MRVHIGNAQLTAELLDYFEKEADCVAVQVGETEIEVSLLGSYRRETHDAAVERLVTEFWSRD